MTEIFETADLAADRAATLRTSEGYGWVQYPARRDSWGRMQWGVRWTQAEADWQRGVDAECTQRGEPPMYAANA